MHAAPAPRSLRRSACWLALASLAIAWPLMASSSQPDATRAAAPASSAARPAPARTTPAPRTSPARAATRPAWSELSAAQQQALDPLASAWSTLSEAQKRKWIALSANFQKLGADERGKLHSRMADWVALSPQQRTQARLNFGETKSLAVDHKRAQWEAYQALPPEEKRRLAAGAQAKTPPTAAAVRPVPAQRLATVPKSSGDARQPRIASAPAPGPTAPAPVPLQQN